MFSAECPGRRYCGWNLDIADGTFDFFNPSLTPAANAGLRVDFGFASVGMEFRHESVNDQPGTAIALGRVLNEGATKVVAGRSISSLFGALDLPLLTSLEADLAAREEHYSGIGNNLRPQITLSWRPNQVRCGRHLYRALQGLGVRPMGRVRGFERLGLHFPDLRRRAGPALEGIDCRRMRKRGLGRATVRTLCHQAPPYDSAALLAGTYAPPTSAPFDVFTYDDFGRMIDFHASCSF